MTTTTNTARLSLKCSPWLMWGLATFFYAYEVLLQVSPGVMVPELMRDFAVDAATLGNLAAVYFYIYAPMQIPVGVLIDRYGSRRLMTLAAACCALGCFLFATAKVLSLAALGRFFIGFGAAFSAIGCMNIAAVWLPIKRFALLTGLMLTAGMLGGIAGETPLAVLIEHVGWRYSLLLLAVVGMILTVLMYIFIRDKKTSTPTTNTSSSSHLLAGLFQVLKQKQAWLIAVYGGLMFAPTSIFSGLWGVPFLMTAYHLD
jgi:predicted MFS family arabinose efflux permease